MVDIPYHTHQFDIPTASEWEIRTGVEAGKAITPDKLFPVLADKADKATTLAGYGIVDAATKEQGQKADTAVQPEQVSAVGYSGRYDDLLNKPSLGSASGLNVGTTAGTVAAGDDVRIVNAAQKSIIVTAGAGLSGGGTLAANIALALSSTSLASLALADTAVQPSRKLTAGTGLTGGGDFSADRTVALNAASIASLAKADTAVQPPAIANFATKAELTAGLGTKLDTGAQAADSAKLQGYAALTLPISTATQTALDGKATTAQGAKADTAVQPSDLGALATKSKVATTDIDATGSTAGGALLTRGGVWVDPSGGGDMFRATYDPNNKATDAFSMGSMVETTSAKIMTAAERTKLAGVATGATANTGTVTSVGVAVPAGLSATGAITTSGTITISYAAGYQGYTTAEASKLAGIPADADKTPPLAAVATTGSYGDLSGKPATFPPSPHTHTPAEVGLGNVANKSEAQMVASGAIADALSSKVSLTAQTLTEEAAGQVRANIGAGILAGFRNKIINGDLGITQRGNSFSLSPGGIKYTADRWTVHNKTNQSCDVYVLPSSLSYFKELGYPPYMEVRFATAPTTGTVEISQPIEEVKTLSGKKATFTYYTGGGISDVEISSHLVQFFGTTAGESPSVTVQGQKTRREVAVSTHRLDFEFDVPPVDDKVINSYNVLRPYIVLTPRRSGGFYFLKVSLVEGDATTEPDPFSPRHIQQELSLCQRYYQRVSELALQQAASVSGGAMRITTLLPVVMRVSPSITYSSAEGTGVAILSSSIADRLQLAAFPTTGGLISASGIKLDAEL